MRQSAKLYSYTGAVLMALAASGAAQAADVMMALPPPVVSAHNWSGAYAGLQIGHSWGRDTTTEYFTATGAFTGLQWSYPANSVIGGVHVGFNMQMGMAVAGVEADVEAIGLKGGFSDPPNMAVGNPGGVGTVRSNWQGSLRARFGFAFDRFLAYGTAGLAFSNFRYDYYNPTTNLSEGTSVARTGWTAGLGVEYAFTSHLSGRLEYRYSNFGKFSYVATSAFLGLTGTQNPYAHALRAAISYRF